MNNVNKEYSDETLGTQETQVTVVGSEFIPGPEGNELIAQARGYTTHRFPNGEVYNTLGPYLMEHTPDYCGDAALCLDLLEQLGVVLMILPTEKPKGVRKFEPGFVALFELADTLYATVPQPTEEAAAACAFWCVLGISHD